MVEIHRVEFSANWLPTVEICNPRGTQAGHSVVDYSLRIMEKALLAGVGVDASTETDTILIDAARRRFVTGRSVELPGTHPGGERGPLSRSDHCVQQTREGGQ